MRRNLKMLRVMHSLTQDEMAEKIGYSRATYQAIEKGKADGRKSFWTNLQTTFNIPDADMWALQKNDGEA